MQAGLGRREIEKPLFRGAPLLSSLSNTLLLGSRILLPICRGLFLSDNPSRQSEQPGHFLLKWIQQFTVF
jgi:hypothetical protein